MHWNLIHAVTFCFFVAQSVLAAESDTNRTGVKWGIAPVSQYSSDQGFTLGVIGRRFDYGDEKRNPFETLTTVQGTYSTLGSTGALASFEKVSLGGSKNLRLWVSASGFRNPFQRYYGVGDSTTFNKSLSSSGYYFYTLNFYSVESSLRIRLPIGFEIRTGLSHSYFKNTPQSGSSKFSEDFSQASQIFVEANYTKILLGTIWEGRDSEFIPSKGHFGLLQFQYAPLPLGTASSSWVRGDLDLRYYFPLVPDRWLWIAGQFILSGSSPEAPLVEKARLGSQGTFRGLSLNRFLTNFSSSQRLDLRSVLVRSSLFGYPAKIGLGLFTDAGHIGDSFPRLFTTSTHFSWGGSLFGSYFTDDFLCNGDLGISQEGMYIYAGLGHAF